MRPVLGFFTSMKLAAVLIAVLALGSAIATVVPQDLDAAAYAAAYGESLGGFLLLSGMTRFFHSLMFLVPAFLLFANLSACTVDRLVRELRKKGRKRHGPDLLHVGLMFLVVGSLLSASGRKEYSAALAPGESALLPDGRVLRLDDFEYAAYDDGRPRDWTSTVTILRDGKPETEAYAVRVNRPLRLGAISLYQDSHSIGAGPELSGLRAVIDPGYPFVLVALVVVAAGAFLAFAQRPGDRKSRTPSPRSPSP